MDIGMVLASDRKTIVPIVDGSIARIFNTKSGQVFDTPNPALGLTEGRRGATVAWMVERGVKVLCAPPGMLCELSYGKAKDEQIKFYRIQPETSFEQFKEQLQSGDINLDEFIPEAEIEPSNPVSNNRKDEPGE